MAKIHEIGIGADTRAFEDQIKSGLIKPTENAEKALERLEDATGGAGRASSKAGDQVDGFADKLAEAARKAGKSDDDIRDALKKMGVSADDARRAVDKLGDEFKDSGRDSERAVDGLEEKLKDAQRETRRLTDDARDVGDGGERGFRKLGDSASEVSSELRQNLGETFSSFRGDLEDLPQIAQDTLGGLAGSGAIGGIAGLAATAAGAAGLGLIIGAFQNIEEERKRLEDRASSLAQAYIDAGTTVLDTVTLAARVSEVLTTPEQRAEAEKLVDVLGVDLPEAARILAGDTNALAAAQEVLTDKNADLNAQRKDGKLLTEEEAAALADQQLKLDSAASSLGVYAENNATAAQTAREYSDALKGMIADAGESTVKVDELGNKLVTLPDNTEVMIDAKTGQATTDITKFKGDADGVIDHVNGKDVVISASASVSNAERDLNAFIGRKRTITVDVVQGGIAAGLKGWDR